MGGGVLRTFQQGRRLELAPLDKAYKWERRKRLRVSSPR